MYFNSFSAKGNEGSERIEEIFSSNNIKNTLDDWYSNDITVGGIKVSEYQAEYRGETWKCGDLWGYINDSLLANYHDKAGKYLSRLDSRDLEMLTGLKDVPKSDFDEIAIQAGIVNSVLDNGDLPVGVAYAGGKTQAEFVQENVGAGYYMSRMLPIMQSIFRALIYALLPAIIAISLLPGGWNIIKNYAKTAVWIELWGVIAAILNFFLLKYTEHNVAGDITVYSASKMLSETSAMAGMAGYLYLMVPAIAWGIMSGSFTMLQGLGSGVEKGFSGNIRTETAAGDSKKMSMKQAASEKSGKDLSFAESLHYRENFAGMKEGVALGVDINQGEVGVKELADYSAQKPYADFAAKKDAMKSLGYSMPTAGLLANTEGAISGGSLAKGLGDLKQTGGTKRMYDRGRMGAAGELGKLDEIGVGGTYKVARGSAAKAEGEVNVSGIEGMRGAGRYAGRTNNAHTQLEKKHGAGLTSAAFYQGNENTIRQNVRGGMLGDDYHASSERQRITTEELPNYNKYDFNGDGSVSPSEAALGGQINTLDGKMGIAGKKAKQDQLAAEADRNRNSASPAVRDAQKAGESLYNDPNAGAIGAAGGKGGVGTRTDSANTRKDSKVLDQLNDNDTNMEDTAVLDSKRMLGDLAQTSTQTETTGGLITDIVDKKGEIEEQIEQAIDKQDPNLSYTQKQVKKDQVLMDAMAGVGIADADLTQRNLQRDVQKIQSETQAQLKTGLLKQVSPEEVQALDTYSQLLSNQEKLRAAGNDKAADIYDGIINQFEQSHDMQGIKKKIEAYHNSPGAQQIISRGQQKLDVTFSSYEQKGLIRRNGDKVEYADTAETIKTLKGDKKALYVERLKRGLDGLKTSTVDMSGMQRERVNDILGSHTTERASATQEWSKTGRFNHDIQYHAVQNDWVDPSNVAKFNTGVDTIKGALGLYGFTRVIKK